MDAMIGDDKKRYKLAGGCTAIVSLFILGKLYVANAGDSRLFQPRFFLDKTWKKYWIFNIAFRAILCRKGIGIPMSNDFTPVSERQRLQQLGYQKPHLLVDQPQFIFPPFSKCIWNFFRVTISHGWTLAGDLYRGTLVHKCFTGMPIWLAGPTKKLL